MGLREIKNRFFRKIAERALSLTSSAGWNSGGGSGIVGSLHLPGFGRSAETVGAVHAAVHARVRAVKKVPLLLSDTNDNILENGPLYDLIAKPNQWQDRAQYLGLIEAYLAMHDWCLIAKIGESDRLPDELIPLDPKKITRVDGIHGPTHMQIPLAWVYSDAGGHIVFKWDDVIPILGSNPHKPFSGLGAVGAAERAIAQDIATREQNLALHKNGGMVDMVLVTSKDLSPDQRKEILDAWRDRHAGYTNAHKTGILWGDLKPEKIGFNPAELQSFENLRMTLGDILMIFQVMPAMVMCMMGETGLSQGSSTAEQFVAWWSNVGLSELDRIAAAHQEFLIDKYNWKTARSHSPTRMESDSLRRWKRAASSKSSSSKIFISFDLNQIEELVEHRMQRVDQFDKIAARGYRPDDISDFLDLGLPPHPTNEGVLPFAVQPVSDVVSGVGDASEPSRVQHPKKRVDVVGALNRFAETIERVECERLAQKHAALQKLFASFTKPREKLSARRWSRFYMEQRDRVLARLQVREQREDGDGSAAGASAAELLPMDEESKMLIERMLPLWTEHLQDGWDFFNENDGVIDDPDLNPFEVDDPNIQDAIKKREIQGLKVNETTEEDLRKIISVSIDEGDSLAQLSDRIADYYNSQCVGEKKPRPMAAARTQTAGIVNQGRKAAADNVGGLLKGWLQGSAEDPREDHTEAMNTYLNNPIPLDQPFVVGGEEMDAPGDANAPAGQVINCTCMITFVSKSEAKG